MLSFHQRVGMVLMFVKELGAHFVIVNTTFSGAESDDILAGNDFRNVGIVVDPTNFGRLYGCNSIDSETNICAKI